jgi:tetratricopeptide (TPR) repeat protein
VRSGELRLAAEQFELGIDRRPNDFWLNFYAGLCAYRLGEIEEAVAAFRVCIALAPETAECYYNHGLACEKLGQIDRALADYSRALALNPQFTDAAINRGIIRYRGGHYADATADLNRALLTANSRTTRGKIYYNLSLVELASGDRKQAALSIEAAVAMGDRNCQALARQLQSRADSATTKSGSKGNSPAR